MASVICPGARSEVLFPVSLFGPSQIVPLKSSHFPLLQRRDLPVLIVTAGPTVLKESGSPWKPWGSPDCSASRSRPKNWPPPRPGSGVQRIVTHLPSAPAFLGITSSQLVTRQFSDSIAIRPVTLLDRRCEDDKLTFLPAGKDQVVLREVPGRLDTQILLENRLSQCYAERKGQGIQMSTDCRWDVEEGRRQCLFKRMSGWTSNS